MLNGSLICLRHLKTACALWLLGENPGLMKTYWRQNLGLGDDAVGEAVLPAFGGDLSPGDLEARDPLMGSHPGHAPQEVAGDVSLVDGERRCQVLRLCQNLWKPQSCWEKGGLGHGV